MLNPLTVTADEAERFWAMPQLDQTRLVESLARYVADDFVFFDVGANTGHFSRKFLTRYSAMRGTAILFEPIRNLSEISQRTLERVRNADILYVNSALGDADGDLTLWPATDGNIGWTTALPEWSEGKTPTMVRVADTRRYVARFRPTVIKIDIEGYEVNVLRGILPFARPEYRPAMVVELGLGVHNPLWPQFLELVGQFRAQGYEVRTLEHTPLTDGYLSTLDKTIDALLVPAGS